MHIDIDKCVFVISSDSFLFICLLSSFSLFAGLFPEVLVRHCPIILFPLLFPAIRLFVELVLFLPFVDSGEITVRYVISN